MTSRCGLLIIVIFTNIVGSSFDGLSMQVVPLACFAQQKKYCEQVRASNCFFYFVLYMIRYLYCCYLKCCQEVIGRETAMRWFCVYHQSKPKAMKERKKAARECNTFCNHQLIFLFSDGLRPKICTRVVGCKFPFLCTSLSSSKGNVYILILWFRLSRV